MKDVAKGKSMEKQIFTLTYPWDKYGYKPIVVFELGVNEDGFVMHITVLESNPRREQTEHLHFVHEDSCVEWFVNFMPKKCDRYFNFEVNANGIMNVAFRKDRYDAQALTLEDIASLGIETKIFAKDWTVTYTVPFTLIKKYIPEYQFEEGMAISTNFYKCGNLTEFPHHGIWNPMPLEVPDFHRPEYFGEVVLE